MPRKGLILLLTIIIAFALTEDASAQCVMCKAVGEQSAKLDGLGRGLNAGILFLMAIPYILMLLGGIVIWRRFNKQEGN
tara:strand:- start:6 stop:242 length:237 start_codon:yes stop_codon:yes gene_type:complete